LQHRGHGLLGVRTVRTDQHDVAPPGAEFQQAEDGARLRATVVARQPHRTIVALREHHDFRRDAQVDAVRARDRDRASDRVGLCGGRDNTHADIRACGHDGFAKNPRRR